jgi:muramoyltetrapeptide carboxypeptidase
LKDGVATGPIIAGNLGTMLALAGTRYFPDLDGVILCIEDDEEESPATIDRFLTQLCHMGVFERIAALVVGRFHPSVGSSDNDYLEEILLTATKGFDIPVAIDFDFGHTDQMFILPNGVQAHVDFCERARLQLLEEPVNKTG